MEAWTIRGNAAACMGSANDKSINVADVAEACIRCEKGTKEGTQGFFGAPFVRQIESPGTVQLMDQGWEGFSDSDSVH